jgi:hypothetical protein
MKKADEEGKDQDRQTSAAEKEQRRTWITALCQQIGWGCRISDRRTNSDRPGHTEHDPERAAPVCCGATPAARVGGSLFHSIVLGCTA